MNLKDLGYPPTLDEYRSRHRLEGFDVGRVISEHKERYLVRGEQGEYEAELIGNLRFNAEKRSDFPAVGDWVAMSAYEVDKALIHAVLPRSSILERQAVGKFGEKQIIATNIDVGLIVQAGGRDFNLNRLERYLTICHASHIQAIVVLSKVDLLSETEHDDLLKRLSERTTGIPIVSVSNQSEIGYSQLMPLIHVGKTYCLLGSSGVGKSTLLNHLAGTERMQTGAISQVADRGRHVTSHRELILLEQGGILIDNPGMREVGIADAGDGLEQTFETIVALAEQCKFNDCSHIQEKGCAIIAAVEQGNVSEEAYANYLKMQREQARFEITAEQKRKKGKAFGRMMKEVKKLRGERKY